MAFTPTPKHLRILQWNCLPFRQRKSQLLSISNDFDVIFLCETWLNPPDYAALKGFVIVRKDKPAGRGGGAAICIRNSLSFYLVDVYNSLNNLESNAISLYFTRRTPHSLNLPTPQYTLRSFSFTPTPCFHFSL